MTPSSEAAEGDVGDGVEDALAGLARGYGLEGDWKVRFTADPERAREMARQYRAAGFEARVLPLFPADREAGPESSASSGEAGHDPLRAVEAEACLPCLEATCVVLTRDGDPAGSDGDLPYG